jgi:hypothetical protein
MILKQLNENEQNIYRFFACKKLKLLQNSTSTNALHKRQLYITKQIGTKLVQNNLNITKADKVKTIVIINKTSNTKKKIF